MRLAFRAKELVQGYLRDRPLADFSLADVLSISVEYEIISGRYNVTVDLSTEVPDEASAEIMNKVRRELPFKYRVVTSKVREELTGSPDRPI
jgi:hypothetical protein